ARLLVAVLLLIATGPWMPVLCLASGHAEVEMPYAACCGATDYHSTKTAHHPVLTPPPHTLDCGDCTDVSLVSVWLSESAPQPVSLETAAAFVPTPSAILADFFMIREADRGECPPSSFQEPCSAPLRC
ncbi:MAG: hypothetical protein ABFD89_26505, partial [Bryobacteraceae bacterium]